MPNLASEQFDRTHSGPELPSSLDGVVGYRRLDLHLNLDTKLETVNQTGVQDEFTRS